MKHWNKVYDKESGKIVEVKDHDIKIVFFQQMIKNEYLNSEDKEYIFKLGALCHDSSFIVSCLYSLPEFLSYYDSKYLDDVLGILDKDKSSLRDYLDKALEDFYEDNPKIETWEVTKVN